MRRQAQAAIEFVLLTAVMLLFFTSVFMVTQSLYVDVQEDRMQQQVYDFFGVLESELLVAHQVGEGYERHIRIPLTFSGLDYTLRMNLNQTSQAKDELVLGIHGQNYLYFLTAPVNGTIDKGWHLIRGGEEVQIQPSDPPSTPPTMYNFCHTPDGTVLNHGENKTYYDRQEVTSGVCADHSQVRECNDGDLLGDEEYQYGSCQDFDSCTLPDDDGTELAHGEESNWFYSQESFMSPQTCEDDRVRFTCNNGELEGADEDVYTHTTCENLEADSPMALGGEISYVQEDDTWYRVHVFTEDESFEVINAGEMNYLVVAGGGGGGNVRGGGGGAGGVIIDSQPFELDTYPVIVGSGGLGGLPGSHPDYDSDWGAAGYPGENSEFAEMIAYGGAGAPAGGASGMDGGSGSGGGGNNDVQPGGSGVTEQGHDGGAGLRTSSPTICRGGGGGGGAASAGTDRTSDGRSGGDGGAGILLDSVFEKTLQTSYIAGGGGGGAGHLGSNNCENDAQPGSGGVGGGGDGGWKSACRCGGTNPSTCDGGVCYDDIPGYDATNYGSGGGGGDWHNTYEPQVAGGSGYQGIVVVYYEVSSEAAASYIQQTPQDGAEIDQGTGEVRVDITTDALYRVSYELNGAESILFDNSLTVMYNFDNLAALGEDSSRIKDVSGSGNYAYPRNGASPVSDGRYGGAYSFDGTNEYVEVPSNLGLFDGSDEFSISLWFNAREVAPDSAWQTSPALFSARGENNMLLTFGDSLSGDTIGLRTHMDSTWSTPVSYTGIQTDQWYHITVTYSPVEGFALYLNGQLEDQNSQTGSISSTGLTNAIAADFSTSDRYFDGLIDGFRIYERAVSSQEATQIYRSNLQKLSESSWEFFSDLNDLSVGEHTYQVHVNDVSTPQRSVNVLFSSGVSNQYFEITSDSSLISSPNTNLYVDLSLAPADFWSEVREDGGDIRIFSSEGNPLAREIAGFSKNDQKGSLFFATPDLSTSSNTVYRVYFGNNTLQEPAPDSDYGQEAVWDDTYASVYHLFESEGSVAYDSTSRSNDGLFGGVLPSSTQGKFSSDAQYFDGSDSDVELPNLHSYIEEGFSVSMWMNKIDQDRSNRWIFGAFSSWSPSSGSFLIWKDEDDRNILQFRIQGVSSTSSSCTVHGTSYDDWMHTYFTYDRSTIHTYVDGQERCSRSFSQLVSSPSGDWYIGFPNRQINARIQEVRVSSQARSSSWIETEYNNQNDPASFWSISDVLFE